MSLDFGNITKRLLWNCVETNKNFAQNFRKIIGRIKVIVKL